MIICITKFYQKQFLINGKNQLSFVLCNNFMLIEINPFKQFFKTYFQDDIRLFLKYK